MFFPRRGRPNGCTILPPGDASRSGDGKNRERLAPRETGPLPLRVWFRAVVQAPTLGRGLWSRLAGSPDRLAPECVTCCRWRFRECKITDPDNHYSLGYGATGILDFDRDHRYRFLWRIPTWGLGAGQTVEIVKGIAADASDRRVYLTFAGQKGWSLPCAMKPARRCEKTA